MKGHKTYILEHLGCANCAAKMEKKINELPQVKSATITFATKQLQVEASDTSDLLPELQRICASIESEVIVREKEEGKKASLQEKKEYPAWLGIGIGAVLFVLAMFLPNGVAAVTYVLAYLILGGKILKQAGKNILKGQVFDENFLMSIATLAAFVIGDYAEAVGVMLFFRVGEYFEEIAVEKSRTQIMDAVDLRPEVVNYVHNSHVHVIPAKEAKIGDVLLVRVGERIPLDGVVVAGKSRIDTAPITGEPVPVSVRTGDKVTSGCINTSGTLQMRVEATLEESMVTRILDAVENAAASKPKIDRFITRFARVYTPVVVGLAVLTAIIPAIVTGDWYYWIYTAISFLVISCPCALVLSVPLAYFAGIGTASKQGILFKGGLAMEMMQHVKAVVMDKTGTITEGNFAVQKCVAVDGEEEALLRMAAIAESVSTHPIAHSIVSEAKERGYEVEQPISVDEIAGKGVCAETTHGKVLCGNRAWMLENQIALSEQETTSGTEVYVALEGNYLGYIVISDTIKSDSKSAIAALKKAGFKTVMLTGDAKESAEAVAKEVGVEKVYAKLLPEEKLSHLNELREKYGNVLFVGDGINDAPVLAGADVGAAMGSGADAAMEAADLVFMTSSMEAIPVALSISKKTNAIALQNVVFAIVIKVAVMILGLLGMANMWMAVFADTGVAMLCVLNSVRTLLKKN